MNEVWLYITYLGEPTAWLALSFLSVFVYCIFYRKNQAARKFVVIFFLGVWITGGIVFATKTLYPVERPCISCSSLCNEIGQCVLMSCNQYCPDDSSFPSGHAASIFAVFTSLFIFLRKRKYLLIFIVPVLVSVSRVMLGVHYPADVVVGAIIGAAVPVIVYYISEKKLKRLTG